MRLMWHGALFCPLSTNLKPAAGRLAHTASGVPGDWADGAPSHGSGRLCFLSGALSCVSQVLLRESFQNASKKY